MPYNVLCVVNKQVAQNAREVYRALRPHGFLQFIPCLDGLDGQPQAHSLDEESYLSFLKTTFEMYRRDLLPNRPISIRQFDNWADMLLGAPVESCAMKGFCSLQFIVESDGAVYPCDFYALDEWRLGNVNEAPLRRIAASQVGQRFVEASLAVPEPCKACQWYRLCRNGCRRERDPETGLSRWCGVMKAFFESEMEGLLRIVESIDADE